MSANTRRIFLCLFVFGSSRLAWSQVQVANEQVAAEMLAKSHPVLLQWLENFDDFEWAEYEISGQSVKVLDESGKTWVREISQLTSHSPTVQRHTTRWKGSAHDRDLCGGTWLQFPDRFVDWQNSQSVGPVISIRPNSNPHLRRHGRAMNPRFVALLGASVIPTLPEVTGSAWVIGKEGREVVSAGDNGLITLSLIPIAPIRNREPAYTRMEATFDESKGTVPVRVRDFLMWNGSTPEGYLTETVDTDYTQIGGRWFPTRIVIEEFSPEYKGPASKWDLNIKWKSVGEKLDPSVFDVNDFGASKGKSIDDYRLSDKGVTVARIGSCLPDGSPLPPDDPIGKLLSEKPAGYSVRVKVIMLVNAVLLGGLGFLFYRRRLRSSANPEPQEDN